MSNVIDPSLLELLRCPVALQQAGHNSDAAKLRLVNDAWLVCDTSGCKYPIRDGIPVMIVEEGMRWKDVPVEKLPVPSLLE